MEEETKHKTSKMKTKTFTGFSNESALTRFKIQCDHRINSFLQMALAAKLYTFGRDSI